MTAPWIVLSLTGLALVIILANRTRKAMLVYIDEVLDRDSSEGPTGAWKGPWQ